jgi:hypothetical protein
MFHHLIKSLYHQLSFFTPKRAKVLAFKSMFALYKEVNFCISYVALKCINLNRLNALFYWDYCTKEES